MKPKTKRSERKQYVYKKENEFRPPKDLLEDIHFSYTERVVDNIPYPETKILKFNDVFKDEKPSPDILKDHFVKEGRIHIVPVLQILKEAQLIFQKESNMIRLEDPINICGDIHGQFYDLLNLFNIGGKVPTEKYLFLGDYVDRGCFGVETILYLFSLKINYPTSLYLLRGNHESRKMTELFTFKREVEVKYGLEIYNTFMEAFDYLPLAALINGEVLCMHGGISPQIRNLQEINEIKRFREPPPYGAMCDLLWSDPLPDYEQNSTEQLFFENSVRGCSYFFSRYACDTFVKKNHINYIVRAHEVQLEGVNLYNKNESEDSSLITVFSAPNYLDMYKNKGAILKYTKSKFKVIVLKEVPHPFWLPNFCNAFEFSMPYVRENISKICLAILMACDDGFLDDTPKTVNIYKKIRSIKKVTMIFTNTREDTEIITGLKGLLTDNQSSEIAKKNSQETLQNVIKGKADFKDIKNLDAINEKYPSKSSPKRK